MFRRSGGVARALGAAADRERKDPMAHPLTLIMPLRPDANVNELGQLIAQQQPAINQALEAVGTVHYARFVLFDGSSPNLQPLANSTGPFSLGVITTYDSSFEMYIQDFVRMLGQVFDALLSFTSDGAHLIPVKDNVQAFIAYVAGNDASQQPPNSAFGQYEAYPYTVQQIKAEVSSGPGA
jgi:hypothetical protein